MRQICTRCLYGSDHPLNLIFDDEGICSGCRVHEEKDLLDWSERERRLSKVLENYRNKSGSNYDCVVPVSGGRDSYFIVHTLKKQFGMNPLLVTYNKQYNTAVGVRNLARLRIWSDSDIMTQTVSPAIVRKITRSTFRRFGSIYWHCLAGQTAFPVQIATKFKIPLIVWGVHQGVDQVGMFSHLDEVEMTRRYRKDHDLLGYEAEDLLGDFDDITDRDISAYRYPDDEDLERVGVRGIYLSNYLRWDSRSQHEKMIASYGYETALQTRTFDTYQDVDCWNYSDVHDYIKFVKHGYGKVIDHACREIRLGHMTRNQGIGLVKKYIHKKPRHLEYFLKWFGITENAFHFVLDQHRKQSIWARNERWEWELAPDFLSFSSQSSEPLVVAPHQRNFTEFLTTSVGKSSDPVDEYILIGKGIL